MIIIVFIALLSTLNLSTAYSTDRNDDSPKEMIFVGTWKGQTPYRAQEDINIGEGYGHVTDGKDKFGTWFISNKKTPEEVAMHYAHVRAAELCIKFGYQYFIVQDSKFSDEHPLTQKVMDKNVAQILVRFYKDKFPLGALKAKDFLFKKERFKKRSKQNYKKLLKRKFNKRK